MKIKLKKLFQPKDTIAIIKLAGIISSQKGLNPGLCLDSIKDKLDEIFKINNLKCLITIINSPGGSPVQSELIYNRLQFLCKKHNVELVAFVEDVAASGGYWIACAANSIYAAQNSIIGSIGVISASFGFEKVIKKLGIERRIYTEGSSKSILDPFLSEKEEDVAILRNVQKEIYNNFKNLVLNSRKSLNTNHIDEIFSGAFWASKKALEYGLIDGIEDIDTYILRRFGKNIKIKNFVLSKSWLKNKLGLACNAFFTSFLLQVKEFLFLEKTGSNYWQINSL